MPQFLDFDQPDFEQAFTALLSAKREDSPDVDDTVAEIIAQVRSKGDAAVIELTQKFDRIALTPDTLRITAAEVDAAVATAQIADSMPLTFNEISEADGLGTMTPERIASTWEWVAKANELSVDSLDPETN